MKVKTTDQEIKAGILFRDPLLFAMLFWKGDLTVPEERDDLEEYLRGNQTLSLEQKLMYCDQSKKVLFCTGRKVCKSLVLEALIIQKSLLNESTDDDTGNDEALVFAPAEGHLKPVVERVYARIERTPVFKAMVTRALRGNKPQLSWTTGLTVWFRVEGTSGTDTNMAGIRAKWVLGDECAFGDFSNHNSRVQTALPNAKWIYAGVPNGVRSSPFYELDRTNLGLGWSRHKYPTFVNPLYWSEKAEADLLKAYGTKNTSGYITQVMGQWGEAMVSSFPPSMIATHNDMAFRMDITATRAKQILEMPNMRDGINIPSVNCKAFAIGNDYGFSPDPSVTMFAIQKDDEDVKNKLWRIYARLIMRSIPLPQQVKILSFMINNLFGDAMFTGFATDKNEMVQIFQENHPMQKDRVTWGFPAHHVISMDAMGNPLANEEGKVIKKGCKQHWTEILKDAMSFYIADVPANPFYLLLAPDTTVINELVGTTENKGSGGYTTYMGPNDPTGSKRRLDHNTDALRELVAAILFGTDKDTKTDTETALLKAMGWAAGGNENWSPPWNQTSL